jgi:ATP-dependent RNA helicase DeaD
MDLPSVDDINVKRTERFKAGVRELVESEDLAVYYRLVSELEQEGEIEALQIAAALARMAQGEVPLLLEPKPDRPRGARGEDERPPRGGDDRAPRVGGDGRRERPVRDKVVSAEPLPLKEFPDLEMERFRVAVGYRDGVKPGNIVGAIANEAELESKYIGHIEIYDEFSLVDLPAGMPKQTMRDLQKAWVCQRQLALQPLKGFDPDTPAGARKARRPRPAKGGGAAETSPGRKGSFKDKRKAVGKRAGKPARRGVEAGNRPLKVRQDRNKGKRGD